MNEKTHEFLEQFSEYENDSIEVNFGDAFSEFINELNDVDLSEKTLEHLNGIFEKDMRIFFKNIEKEGIKDNE